MKICKDLKQSSSQKKKKDFRLNSISCIFFYKGTLFSNFFFARRIIHYFESCNLKLFYFNFPFINQSQQRGRYPSYGSWESSIKGARAAPPSIGTQSRAKLRRRRRHQGPISASNLLPNCDRRISVGREREERWGERCSFTSFWRGTCSSTLASSVATSATTSSPSSWRTSRALAGFPPSMASAPFGCVVSASVSDSIGSCHCASREPCSIPYVGLWNLISREGLDVVAPCTLCSVCRPPKETIGA